MYKERQQIYVLLGELCETTAHLRAEEALSYFAGVLAVRLLPVLADPLHFMYIKASKFLNRGPIWNLSKLPSYWVDRIIMHEPSDDNGYYMEVEWLIDLLIDGLRTVEVC